MLTNLKSTKLFFETQEPRLKLAILAFFVVSFLFLLEVLSDFKSQETETTAIKTVNAPAVDPLKSDAPLFSAPLFGVYIPKDLSQVAIQQSRLDLKIVGILFSNNNEQSQVIIRGGGGEETIYTVGDTLPGGAMIQHISDHHVILLYHGVLERLSLPKKELRFNARAKPLIEE